MTITLDGTLGITSPAETTTNLAYTGTLTGSTGILNIGSGQVYKDASGNVGIGTSSPSYKLDVSGTGRFTSSLSILTGATATAGLIVGSDATPGNTWTIARDNVTTGDLKFIGNTTERMRIDSSGNVGIGVVPTTGKGILQYSSTNGSYMTRGDATSSLATFNSEHYLISNAVLSSTGSWTANATNSSTLSARSGNIVFTTDSGLTSGSAFSPTERMRIDSSGNLLVGTTSNLGGKLSVAWASASQGGIILKTTSETYNGAPVVFQNSSGGIAGFIGQGTSSVGYNTSSDYRLKENIAPMTGALSKVAALKPVTYTWKVDGADGQGFIAHELAEVVPDCVTGEKDAVDAEGKPQYQGIDTSFLVATLTAAIQELKAIIDTQQARIEALEARV